jgi:hypothetical protein
MTLFRNDESPVLDVLKKDKDIKLI